MIDKKSQYEVAVAALFHDIGKFKQRAYKGNESIIKDTVDTMEGYIGKLNSKTKLYTHRHALWTYDFFINDFKPLIDSMDLDIKLNWERVFITSASHHVSDSDEYSRAIQSADIISASNDRSDSNEAYKRGDYYKKPLRPIFSNINIKEYSGPKKSKYYYNLSLSDLNNNPVEQLDSDIELNYNDLWNSFILELKKLPRRNTLNGLLLKLKDLLYQYTWCMPSATNDIYNDISLYDHSITTMVFALAIINSNINDKFRIFAADLSGIQQFIFQSKYSSFKGAAKIFRGRSFIISSISNAYKIALCKKINIIPFIDLIDAGGKFTMILPSDNNLINLIDEFVKEQEFFFFNKYQGSLCVLTDYSLIVNGDGFGRDNFVQTQKDIGYLLNSKKTRKFENCINKVGFVNNNVNIKGKRCSVCGKNVITDKDICNNCNSIQQIGANIIKYNFINYNKHIGYEIVKGVFLSVDNKVLDDNYISFVLSSNDEYPMWRLNTHSPDKTFEEISTSSINEEGLGKKFLAYVKIDVDNLGEIFISGFPKEIYTISRYVTISRLLNNFFNVQVKQLLEKKYFDAYTVISGGDDIFIILPWNQAIDFIEELKLRFRIFCCNNLSIHFSASIVVGTNKEPFALLNERANYELDIHAKEFQDKNRTSYFNVLFDEDELRELSNDITILKKFIDEYGVSSSFIYRMYNYVNDLMSKIDSKKWSVYSKVRYDLVRNIKVKNENELIEIYNFFLNHIDNYNGSFDIERFRVALIHTMYEFREE